MLPVVFGRGKTLGAPVLGTGPSADLCPSASAYFRIRRVDFNGPYLGHLSTFSGGTDGVALPRSPPRAVGRGILRFPRASCGFRPWKNPRRAGSRDRAERRPLSERERLFSDTPSRFQRSVSRSFIHLFGWNRRCRVAPVPAEGRGASGPEFSPCFLWFSALEKPNSPRFEKAALRRNFEKVRSLGSRVPMYVPGVSHTTHTNSTKHALWPMLRSIPVNSAKHALWPMLRSIPVNSNQTCSLAHVAQHPGKPPPRFSGPGPSASAYFRVNCDDF